MRASDGDEAGQLHAFRDDAGQGGGQGIVFDWGGVASGSILSTNPSGPSGQPAHLLPFEAQQNSPGHPFS
jgi:hypothetical protein